MVTGLQRVGHDVVLFAAAGSMQRGLRAVCEPTGGLNPESADAAESEAYFSVVKALQSEPRDIVHFNALHSLQIDMAGSIPAPFLAAVHCHPLLPFERSLNAASPHVVWLSVSSAFSRLWPDPPREAIVIKNGVDLSRFKFDPVPDDPPYALW